ncbi:unnamed protein product [Brassica rapa]|uniref:Uncharacterized protein n=1 Tax=Brassica campestris TaxID=3711 RepID=A0A8D9LMV4_BRACM|nr:unnamed protein product [Brassica rapa]
MSSKEGDGTEESWKNEETRIMFLNSAAEQVRGIIVGKQDMVGKGRIETDIYLLL